MGQYNIIVKDTEKRFPVRIKGNTTNISVVIKTLTPSGIFIGTGLTPNKLVLKESSAGTSKESFISISHGIKSRDRIAIDGKETLYVSVSNSIGLDSAIADSGSADKAISVRNEIEMKSSVNASIVKYATVSDIDSDGTTNTLLSDLDGKPLEDIDYIES